MSERHERVYSGLIGRNCKFSNVITITHTHCINGGDETAFGGSRTWPCLQIQVEVQEGESEVLKEIDREFVALLHKHHLIGRREHHAKRTRPRRTD
jgi:hypothetical protein